MFEEDYLSYVDDEVKTLDYFDEDESSFFEEDDYFDFGEEIPF